MSSVSDALSVRVLAMNMSDVRQTISAVGEQQAVAPAAQAQPADVILQLSTAAQQLLGKS
jgi:hypothetical protein